MRYKIYKSIEETIGNTPLVELQRIGQNLPGKIVVKLESFNPMSSVKDRICAEMIKQAEHEGRLRPGMTIVESTSGNTGIGLAFLCASKGYKLILTMPDSMSVERRQLLKILGAELVLTEGAKGMPGANAIAENLVREKSGRIMLRQFENRANPKAHYETTAVEIWNDTKGAADIVISGVGTGGTLMGISRYMKERKPSFRAIAVEPVESPVLSGGKPGGHKIQGIGAGFIPKIVDTKLIDGIVRVESERAGEMSRRMAKEEGMLVGISSGAAMVAALKIAARISSKGKLIVVILPDTGERYLSTWLFADAK